MSQFLWAGRPSLWAVREASSALPRQAASPGAEVRGAQSRLCGHDLSVPSALGRRLEVQGSREPSWAPLCSPCPASTLSLETHSARRSAEGS